MNESYTDLPERIRKSFSEIDSDIVADLRTTSEEYADSSSSSLPPARICGEGGDDRSNEGESSPVSQRSGNAV